MLCVGFVVFLLTGPLLRGCLGIGGEEMSHMDELLRQTFSASTEMRGPLELGISGEIGTVSLWAESSVRGSSISSLFLALLLVLYPVLDTFRVLVFFLS